MIHNELWVKKNKFVQIPSSCEQKPLQIKVLSKEMKEAEIERSEWSCILYEIECIEYRITLANNAIIVVLSSHGEITSDSIYKRNDSYAISYGNSKIGYRS